MRMHYRGAYLARSQRGMAERGEGEPRKEKEEDFASVKEAETVWAEGSVAVRRERVTGIG